MTDQPRMLTVYEVAKFLRIGKSSAYRLIDAKVLPAYRVGRTLRVDQRDLNRYLRTNWSGS